LGLSPGPVIDGHVAARGEQPANQHGSHPAGTQPADLAVGPVIGHPPTSDRHLRSSQTCPAELRPTAARVRARTRSAAEDSANRCNNRLQCMSLSHRSGACQQASASLCAKVARSGRLVRHFRRTAGPNSHLLVTGSNIAGPRAGRDGVPARSPPQLRQPSAIVCNTAAVHERAMDERVTTAISNWSPRFIANGIDHSDFARVTATIKRWDQWCAAWCAAGGEHEELGRTALAEGRGRSAGTHLAQAAAYYHFAKFVFVQDPDQMRAAHEKAVRCLTDALPHLDPPGERVVIPFDGAELVGNLRRPLRPPGPHPVVLLIPGLDSTKAEFGATE